MPSKKKKKLISVLLLAILMVTIALIQVAAMNTTPASNGVVDDTFTVGGLEYKITSTDPAKVAVTGLTYGYAPTNIILPNEVTNVDEKYSVTSIGDKAFCRSGITSIVIPQSVMTIGDKAFYYCSALTSVEITNTENAPSKLRTIGKLAFYNNAIQSIDIPQSVTSIGEYAFYDCDALSNVKITNTENAPSMLNKIDEGAFYDNGIQSIAIPQSVRSIGDKAFYFCEKLTDVTIKNEVSAESMLKTIGESAFHGSSIQSIAIPQSVTTIGDNAFRSCTALSSVGITNTADKPSNLQTIGVYAFYSSVITSIAIPQSVITIDNNAFYACSKLKSVEITNTENAPSMLYTIGNYAFASTIITSIVIPQSVTSIGFKTFDTCRSLTSVEITNTADKPSKLETIGERAFYYSGITSIVIPQKVTSIGDKAFGGYSKLSVIVFKGATVPTFGSELFDNAEKDIKAYVPWVPKADYKTALEADAVLSGYNHTLTVLGYGELVFTKSSLDDAKVLEEGYNQSITTTDGIEAEIVEYTMTAGALPEGLSMDVSGNITGTATKVGKSTFTVTAKVSNAVANLEYSAEKEYTINVTDTIAPDITVVNETVTIEINGGTDEEKFLELAGASATDNSFVTPTITTDFADVKQNVLGEKIVTITATDGSGNTSKKEITVNVTDTIAPDITVVNETVTIEINGGTDEAKFLELVNETITDNSNGAVTITTDFANIKQNVLGEKIVTITATDGSGNTSKKEITVKVVDTTPEPTTEEPTTEEPTIVTEKTTEVATTEGSGTGVETGDTLVTPLFFTIALFSVLFILASRKKEKELQG